MKARLKLTNVVDKILIERGLLSPKCLRGCEVEGVVDTQVLGLVIPLQVAQSLGLKLRNQSVDWCPPGEEPVGMSEPIAIEYGTHQTILEALVLGEQVRVGRIVLDLLGVSLNGSGQEKQSTAWY